MGYTSMREEWPRDVAIGHRILADAQTHFGRVTQGLTGVKVRPEVVDMAAKIAGHSQQLQTMLTEMDALIRTSMRSSFDHNDQVAGLHGNGDAWNR
jgi:hypothetical protein